MGAIGAVCLCDLFFIFVIKTIGVHALQTEMQTGSSTDITCL